MFWGFNNIFNMTFPMFGTMNPFSFMMPRKYPAYTFYNYQNNNIFAQNNKFKYTPVNYIGLFNSIYTKPLDIKLTTPTYTSPLTNQTFTSAIKPVTTSTVLPDYAQEFSRKTEAPTRKNRVKMALLVAEQELAKNVKENLNSKGKGTNDSVDIRRYKNGVKDGNPWCASFFSYLYGAGQGSSNSDTFGYTASSQEIKRKAIANKTFANKNSGYIPQPGDAAIWTDVNDPSHGHIGIVHKVDNTGVWIIEGNKSDAVKEIHYTYKELQKEARFSGYAKMNEWAA